MKSVSLCIISIFLFSSLLHAGDQMSWLHKLMHTQAPFGFLNKPERRRYLTVGAIESVYGGFVQKGIPADHAEIYVIAALSSYEEMYEILNLHANAGLFVGAPFIFPKKTCIFGLGIVAAATMLKARAAYLLPTPDADYAQFKFNMMRDMRQIESIVQSLQKIEQQQTKDSRNNGPSESV